MLSTIHGTGWPILCWRAVKNSLCGFLLFGAEVELLELLRPSPAWTKQPVTSRRIFTSDRSRRGQTEYQDQWGSGADDCAQCPSDAAPCVAGLQRVSDLPRRCLGKHILTLIHHVCDSTMAWRSGNALCLINELTLWRARLALGWVTVYGQVNHLGMKPVS